MLKTYSRINWENEPSLATPLNEANLNRMDLSLDAIDDRVIALDATKLDLETGYTMVKTVTLNQETGIITVEYLNGSMVTYDTKLEKLAVNFRYDPERQQLIIELDDGTEQTVDMSALITEYEFDDTPTIAFSNTGGRVSAAIVSGSITAEQLQPNYLADVTTQAAIATAEAQHSATSAGESLTYRNESEDFYNNIKSMVTAVDFYVDDATGELMYSNNAAYDFRIDDETGELEWRVA